MKAHSRRLAFCSMVTALSVTLMLVVGLTGIGTYAAPVIAGGLLVVVRQSYGTKTALTVWLSVGLLGLLIVPDRELVLFHLVIYGWYPAVRPLFMRLPRVISLLARYGVFNLAVVVTYTFIMALLGMTEEGLFTLNWLYIIFLLMMNLIFYLQDAWLIPKIEENHFQLPN